MMTGWCWSNIQTKMVHVLDPICADYEPIEMTQDGFFLEHIVQWVNAPCYIRSDYELAGKPLHGVLNNRSACGLMRSQWVEDLFNETRCQRCLQSFRKQGYNA